MISNFLRKLNPYAGYMGGGSDSGGGGGGGGSTVSDDEFEAAIAQDEANKASGGGGVSYGTGGYVGSDSSSSSPDPVVTAPTVYTANDGTKFTNAAKKDAHNQALYEAEVTQRVDSGFETFYNDYLTQIETEKGYYTADDVTNALDAAIASIPQGEASYLSVNTDRLQNNYLNEAVTEVDFNTLYETMLNDLSAEKGYYTADDVNTAYALAEQYLNPTDGQMAINQVALSDDVLKAMDWATEAEKITGDSIAIEPLIGAPDESGGYFDWLTGMFNDPYVKDSDTVKTYAVEDFAISDILNGSQFKIDDNGVLIRQGARSDNKEYTKEELNQIQRQDLGIYLDYTGNTDNFDAEDLQYAWTDKTIELYGDNSLGFTEFAKDITELQNNVTGFATMADLPLVEGGMKAMTLPEDSVNPNTGEVIPAGTVMLADPFSAQGIAANIGDAISNGIISFFTGGILGDIAYGLTNSNTTALGTAMLSENLMKLAKPIDNTIYLTPNGGVLVEQSVFGKTEYVPLESVFQNLMEGQSKANEAVINYGSDSSDFDAGSSIEAGISMAGRDAGASGSSWKDYYNFSLNPKDMVNEVISGNIVLDPEVVKGIEFADNLNSGDSIVDAAIKTYGDKLTDMLPDGWEQPTETAIRLAAGENQVAVLSDVYGEDIGLTDAPIDQAAVQGLITLDQTGDLQSAAEKALITYVKEGGEFPDFTLPDAIDISLPEIDLSGIDLSFPDLDIDFAGLRNMVGDINIPNIDFSGVKFPELDIDLPSLADLGVDIGSIDFSGMSFPELNLSLPDLSQYDLNLGDISFEGVAWQDLNIDWGEIPNFDIAWEDIDFTGIPIQDVEFELPKLSELGIDISQFDWPDFEGVDFPEIGLPDLTSMLAGGTVSYEELAGEFEWVEPEEGESLARKLLNAKLV